MEVRGNAVSARLGIVSLAQAAPGANSVMKNFLDWVKPFEVISPHGGYLTMRQAEIQPGGLYLSKGVGMREGRRVRVIRIIPQTEGPSRVEIVDEQTGKKTRPLAPSFQASYRVEKIPQMVTDLRKGAVGGQQMRVGKFDVSAELDALREALEAALRAVEGLKRKVG